LGKAYGLNTQVLLANLQHFSCNNNIIILNYISFLVYFLPILGGQNSAVSYSAEAWCSAGNLGASRVLIRMDDRTDGQRTDDGTDDRTHGFRGGFISHPDARDGTHGVRGRNFLPLLYVMWRGNLSAPWVNPEVLGLTRARAHTKGPERKKPCMLSDTSREQVDV